MLNKIFIGIISVLFTGGSLFAQQNTEATNAKKVVCVPVMTKELRADKINKERIKQAEMKKNDVSPVEKNAVINKENEINPATIEESQSNDKLLKIESKEILLNKTETEKVILIESEKPDKK